MENSFTCAGCGQRIEQDEADPKRRAFIWRNAEGHEKSYCWVCDGCLIDDIPFPRPKVTTTWPTPQAGNTLDWAKLQDSELDALALHGKALGMRKAALAEIKRRVAGVYSQLAPTVAGWYWLRPNAGSTAAPVFVGNNPKAEDAKTLWVWSIGNATPLPLTFQHFPRYLWAPITEAQLILAVKITNTTEGA